MDWVRDFYSTTGHWWGPAEGRITDRDHRRVEELHRHTGRATPMRVLELGSGYGTTAAALANAGHAVTAVEISDRLAYRVPHDGPGTVEAINDDFYAVRLTGRFDAVCYYNGFGIGTDADQRRLLKRIADDWLADDGVALIDVYNPFVWARWDGDEEHRLPDPSRGYAHELRERTTFDPVTCTAADTWWDVAHPDEKITQTLRCYTPADLLLLLEGTGLAVTSIGATGPDLLDDRYEYLVALRRRGAS